MEKIKISGPVTAIILVIAVMVVILIGNRLMNPPQKLDPMGQAMMDSIRRSRPPGGQ
jgi:hypothetical protein